MQSSKVNTTGGVVAECCYMTLIITGTEPGPIDLITEAKGQSMQKGRGPKLELKLFDEEANPKCENRARP